MIASHGHNRPSQRAFARGKNMAQEIEKLNPSAVPSTDVINLGSNSLLDLTGMPPDQIAELKRQYASGMIDLKKKAEDLKIENASLAMTLDSFNTEASKATQANVSITATHTQTTAIGWTEVVIGNTDRMRSVHSDRMGGGLSHEISNVAEAETLGTVEGSMCGIVMRDAVAPPGSKATSRPKGTRRNLRGLQSRLARIGKVRNRSR